MSVAQRESIELVSRRGAMGLVAALFLVPFGVFYPSAVRSSGYESAVRFDLPSGVNARVYPAELLESLLVEDGLESVIPLEHGGYVSVVTDIDDPLIENKGDGQFHPFETEHVAAVLHEIDHPLLDLDVEIYLLPYPRRNVLVSSTSGSTVFLSPHVYDISKEAAAYIVAHEVGHVFQHRYMPASAHRRWEEYRSLRGIEDHVRYSSTARHADRPEEIFAEDFRVLFGGPSAYFGGRVENPDLAVPEAVAGLRSFILGLAPFPSEAHFIVAMESYPNPFNPDTEIHVTLDEGFLATGMPVRVRVYDARGALVRNLFDERPTGSEVRVQWDGLDAHGRGVASAVYFGVAEAGDSRRTQKLLMIK